MTSATQARRTSTANGPLLKNHKAFISSGHDEYWSPGQRSNVQSALASGVSLAFFSGNEIFWKTRWGPSIDGSNTPYRTLTTYKETHYNSQVDPQDPPTWTGAWATQLQSAGGRRRSGQRPHRAAVPRNSGSTSLMVPSSTQQAPLLAEHGGRQPRVLARPPHSPQTRTQSATSGTPIRTTGSDPPVSSTCPRPRCSGVQAFTDYGSLPNPNATDTHHLSLYRAPSGALVFGAGTVQWSWGLRQHERLWQRRAPIPKTRPTRTCSRQRSICSPTWAHNPERCMTGLVAAAQSTDTTPPTSSDHLARRRRQSSAQQCRDRSPDGHRHRRRCRSRGRRLDRRRLHLAPRHAQRRRCRERQLVLHVGGPQRTDDDDHVASRRRQRQRRVSPRPASPSPSPVRARCGARA